MKIARSLIHKGAILSLIGLMACSPCPPFEPDVQYCVTEKRVQALPTPFPPLSCCLSLFMSQPTAICAGMVFLSISASRYSKSGKKWGKLQNWSFLAIFSKIPHPAGVLFILLPHLGVKGLFHPFQPIFASERHIPLPLDMHSRYLVRCGC